MNLFLFHIWDCATEFWIVSEDRHAPPTKKKKTEDEEEEEDLNDANYDEVRRYLIETFSLLSCCYQWCSFRKELHFERTQWHNQLLCYIFVFQFIWIKGDSVRVRTVVAYSQFHLLFKVSVVLWSLPASRCWFCLILPVCRLRRKSLCSRSLRPGRRWGGSHLQQHWRTNGRETQREKGKATAHGAWKLSQRSSKSSAHFFRHNGW